MPARTFDLKGRAGKCERHIESHALSAEIPSQLPFGQDKQVVSGFFRVRA